MPAAPHPRTLLDVLASTVTRVRDSVALDAPDATLTYGQLADAARELAARLNSLGVGPGDRVGVHIPSGTAELYVAILGVLHAGAAYVPVDAEDPPQRAAAIWRHAGVCAVVTPGLAIDELRPARGANRAAGIDDDAWIIFTSGSTGEPKGVAVTHRAAAAFVDSEARLVAVDRSDRVLAGLSVAFDASCEEMWLAWRHGAALVPAPRSLVRSGGDLGPWLRERGITVISTVPTLAAMWSDDALSDVRLIVLGGEACPAQLGWRLASGREVWNTYGPTEATVVATAGRIRPGEPITIGRPLDGWEVAVVDAGGTPVPPGDTGELVISGVGLGRYLDPELDASRFGPLPSRRWPRSYMTGDVVRETPAGLEFVGRADDQVKIAGRRLELGEVDARLRAAPGVEGAATAVRGSAAGHPLLVGYVVGDVDPDEVRAYVEEWLPSGVRPLVIPVDSLPTRGSGKVDREALPWPPPSVGGAAQKLTGTSAWVAERWAEQLGPLSFDTRSDFFDLGGTSLAAAKLVSALRRRFPTVAVADVYRHRRLGDLAEHLDRLADSTRRGPVAAVRPRRAWGAAQSAGIVALTTFVGAQWLLGILAYNDVQGPQLGPRLGWGWLVLGWLALASAPGRAAIVLAARRVLLGRLKPGRYPRHSWLAYRMWFLERLAALCHLENLAGTPWARRYARLTGATVGRGASLASLPSPGGLVEIGQGASIEAEVDMKGWWIEGDELVVGLVRIGAGASVGTRALLMPGADIGDRAEIDPGTVIDGRVPAGERWGGCPARRMGLAGEGWPADRPELRTPARWKAMYALGLATNVVVPVAAALPGLALVGLLSIQRSPGAVLRVLVLGSPLIAVSFFAVYGLLTVLLFRAASRLVQPGLHSDEGAVPWALWFTETLLTAARGVLFPLYSSVYTRPWLRLLGLAVGRRTEVSTAVGLSPLVAIGETSFLADDVVCAPARSRGGWLRVDPIEVG
ncbi:MAG: amino acid adenylation domain-containing protein, partial [Actinobacteria bacterium]|nr:amino acid adenylation domain-containing protein [Actinomycetota bacterium]